MPKKKQESKAKTTSKSRKARAVRKVEASIPDKSKSKIRSDRILQKARDFLDKGKNEKAIEAVDQILTGEVHDEDLMTFLIASRISAFASVNLKNYDKAAETALQALKFRDDIPDFFYILTLSYAGMEELDQAEEYAGKFLALVSRQQHECNIPDMLAETRSKTYLVYNLLGTALREQERYEEAGQAFEKSYNDNPEYAAAYINHAKLLHGLGDDDGACRVFNLALQNGLEAEEIKMLQRAYMSQIYEPSEMTESVENDPSKQRGEESSNCLNAHFRSGQIEYNRGNLQEALNHLQAETRTHPDNWSAYYMIGEIYNLMENESAAEEAFLEAYNICRDDVKLLYSLARLYFDTDRLEESVKYLEIIQSIDRDFIEAYRLRGEINFRLGEYREACDAFTNIAMRNPNDPEVWNNLGNSHFKLEEFEQARQCYEKVIEIDSTYSMAYRNLAVCEIRLNNFENAYGILKEYLELASEDYNMIVMAAEIAINLEKFDEARDYIDKALGINPNSPQLLMLLGDCYYAAGLLESSKIQFEQALQIDPKFNQARQRLMQIIEIQDARKR